MLELGVQPDVLVCRTEKHLSADLRRKVALFCNVNVNAVIESIDADSIYDVPLLMYKEQLDKVVLNKLKLPLKHEPELDQWKIFLGKLKNPVNEVRIGLVGKYVELKDAYKSIVEAFIHGGVSNECKVKLEWIHSEKIDAENVAQRLQGLNGVLV
ncbi:MAG: CTP synthase, partial [Flavobacteriales bacterium]